MKTIIVSNLLGSCLGWVTVSLNKMESKPATMDKHGDDVSVPMVLLFLAIRFPM